MSGEVQRWHTWPTIRQQTMSSHEWNVARIALAIFPQMSRDVIIECLFHDVGEVATGDHPTYSKTDVKFRAELRRLERQARLEMTTPWGLPHERPLTDMERWVIKLADILDRWEFALHETALGNTLCLEVVRNTEESLSQRTVEGYPGSNAEVADSVRWYMEARRKAHAGR